MDPIFNEKCADALSELYGVTENRYTLMVKDGIYQWRWINQPIGVKDRAVSPMFKTLEEAKAWGEKRHTGECCATVKAQDGWKPFMPITL